MKKGISKIIIMCYLIGVNVLCSQTLTIPDIAFKNKLLESNSSNTIAKNLNGNFFAIDSNSDGEIQNSEAEQVSYLYLDFVGNPVTVTSLNGIESFINLHTLITYELAIENFDYSLPNLTILDLSYHLIEELDLRNLCSLESFATIQSPSNLANKSLKEIYLKNNSYSLNSFSVTNGNDLNYVCLDSPESTFIQSELSGYSGITFDSTCSLIIYCSTLSLSDHSANTTTDFHIYPNPVATSLNIKTDLNIESISIVNVNGKEIISNNNVTDKKIDISKIPSGIYFIIAKTLEKDITRKIIKK